MLLKSMLELLWGLNSIYWWANLIYAFVFGLAVLQKVYKFWSRRATEKAAKNAIVVEGRVVA